jgi:hypothetical protein
MQSDGDDGRIVQVHCIPILRALHSQLLKKGIQQKKTPPCPMGLTTSTSWPSAMARNSFQRANVLQKIELTIGSIGDRSY